MLYLTLQDDPFQSQKYDESALLELVRSVARRDSEDRTLSELIRFQDALERLGLLWTPLDYLYKGQALELVRNLHLEFAAPGDVVYIKHSPAMRSYVVLKGKILLSKNVLDREGNEGVRVLGPGDEFGVALDADQTVDDAVPDFEDYARTAPVDFQPDVATTGDGLPAVLRGERMDGKAELLSVRRQDWATTLSCSREKFARMVAKDVGSKKPDGLKDAARMVFNREAKGRSEEDIRVAEQYLMERVPFCSDLPADKVSSVAKTLELRGLTVPGRVIFARARECYGEAYVMFTGTADQRGRERSGDRLIKEGDLFGDEHFGAGVGHMHANNLRTVTVVSRTSPCELLLIPPRECQMLQAFVAARNSEKAMVVFEKYFHNMPRQTSAELSTLASFRKLTMHENLAIAGDDVSTVFFVFRGECTTKRMPKNTSNSNSTLKATPSPFVAVDMEQDQQRYAPGQIVGWQYLMPEAQVVAPSPSKNGLSIPTAGPVIDNNGVRTSNLLDGEQRPSPRRRRRRFDKEWPSTVAVTTPAQVLSLPRLTLLSSLSSSAMAGLRGYIAATQGPLSDQEFFLNSAATPSSSTRYEDDAGSPEANSPYGGQGANKELVAAGGFDFSAYFGDDRKRQGRTTRTAMDPTTWCRPTSSPGISTACLVPLYNTTGRPRTTPETCSPTRHRREVVSTQRSRSPTRWRWREKIGDNADSSPGCRRGASSAMGALGSVRGSDKREEKGTTRGMQRREGGGCRCPAEKCFLCSPGQRLERFHQTPPWMPSLPPRPAAKPGSVVSPQKGAAHKATATIDTSKNSLPGHHSASRRPEAFQSLPPTDGETVEADVLEGTVVAASSHKGDGGAETADGWGSRSGEEALKRTRGGPGAVTTGAITATAVTEGVNNAWGVVTVEGVNVKGGILTEGLVRRERKTGAAQMVEAENRAEQRTYALAQLSTRPELDRSDPSASICLRLLGSFDTEAEATTRVLNLYHAVLSHKPAWRTFHRGADHSDPRSVLESASASATDCVFLLRKGVPVQYLIVSIVASVGGAGVCTTNCGNNAENADGEATVGRGYDFHFPAVFKAQEQYFAVTLAPSMDSVTHDWQQQQQRQQKQQQQHEADRVSAACSSEAVLNTMASGDKQRNFNEQPHPCPSVPENADPSVQPIKGAIKIDDTASLSRTSAAGDTENIISSTIENMSSINDPPLSTVAGGDSVAGQCGEPNDGAVNSADWGVEGHGNTMANVKEEVAEQSRVGDVGYEEQSSGMEEDTAGLLLEQDASAIRVSSFNWSGYSQQEAEAAEIATAAARTDAAITDSNTTNANTTTGTATATAGAPEVGAVLARSFSDLFLSSDTEDDTLGTEESLQSGGRRGYSSSSRTEMTMDDTVTDTKTTGKGYSQGVQSRSGIASDCFSWMLHRTGIVDKMEGCYETEAAAFRKAVKILDGIEASTAGERASLIRPSRAPNPASTSSLRRDHPRACVLPLYRWLSLGDGGVKAIERAILIHSVSDPTEATLARLGLDISLVWMDQRTRALRSNMFNMLRAAGPREIRHRCARVSEEKRSAGVSAEGLLTERGSSFEGFREDDMGVGDERDRSKKRDRNSRRRNRTTVQAARRAVLQQNQTLIQTEMGMKKRMLEATAAFGACSASVTDEPMSSSTSTTIDVAKTVTATTTSATTIKSNPKPNAVVLGLTNVGASRKENVAHQRPEFGRRKFERSGSSITEERASGAGLGAGVQVSSGAEGAARRGEGGPGGRGRQQLRVQMNIERKRARLFEDIRMLPYTGTKGGRHNKNQARQPIDNTGKKVGGVHGARVGVGRDGGKNTSPAAMVLRAATVRFQARLHGRPPTSFFAQTKRAASAKTMRAIAASSPSASANMPAQLPSQSAELSGSVDHAGHQEDGIDGIPMGPEQSRTFVGYSNQTAESLRVNASSAVLPRAATAPAATNASNHHDGDISISSDGMALALTRPASNIGPVVVRPPAVELLSMVGVTTGSVESQKEDETSGYGSSTIMDGLSIISGGGEVPGTGSVAGEVGTPYCSKVGAESRGDNIGNRNGQAKHIKHIRTRPTTSVTTNGALWNESWETGDICSVARAGDGGSGGVKPSFRRGLSTAPVGGGVREGRRRRRAGGDGSLENSSGARAVSSLCNLDGELVLLDGVLHDPRVKAWVENSLRVPHTRQ